MTRTHRYLNPKRLFDWLSLQSVGIEFIIIVPKDLEDSVPVPTKISNELKKVGVGLAWDEDNYEILTTRVPRKHTTGYETIKEGLRLYGRVTSKLNKR